MNIDSNDGDNATIFLNDGYKVVITIRKKFLVVKIYLNDKFLYDCSSNDFNNISIH